MFVIKWKTKYIQFQNLIEKATKQRKSVPLTHKYTSEKICTPNTQIHVRENLYP